MLPIWRPRRCTPPNLAALLAGIYLIKAIIFTLIINFWWTLSSIAGQTQRVVAVTPVWDSFGVGNIIGPQTFPPRNTPVRIAAMITVLAAQDAVAAFADVLLWYYV